MVVAKRHRDHQARRGRGEGGGWRGSEDALLKIGLEAPIESV